MPLCVHNNETPKLAMHCHNLLQRLRIRPFQQCGLSLVPLPASTLLPECLKGASCNVGWSSLSMVTAPAMLVDLCPPGNYPAEASHQDPFPFPLPTPHIRRSVQCPVYHSTNAKWRTFEVKASCKVVCVSMGFSTSSLGLASVCRNEVREGRGPEEHSVGLKFILGPTAYCSLN